MRKLCDVDEVRKCLDEVTGDDSVYAKGLLEWAIRKRTIDESDIRADERKKVIDEFLNLLISETCEDCKECEPRLSTDWMPKFACCEEGYVKFYMKLAEQMKGEQHGI